MIPILLPVSLCTTCKPHNSPSSHLLLGIHPHTPLHHIKHILHTHHLAPFNPESPPSSTAKALPFSSCWEHDTSYCKKRVAGTAMYTKSITPLLPCRKNHHQKNPNIVCHPPSLQDIHVLAAKEHVLNPWIKRPMRNHPLYHPQSS